MQLRKIGRRQCHETRKIDVRAAWVRTDQLLNCFEPLACKLKVSPWIFTFGIVRSTFAGATASPYDVMKTSRAESKGTGVPSASIGQASGAAGGRSLK